MFTTNRYRELQDARSGIPRTWDEGYALVSAFISTYQHMPTPTQTVNGGIQIGKWVDIHHRLYTAGLLPMDQVDALNNIPGWCWTIPFWQANCAILKQYVNIYGCVPSPGVEYCGIRIGSWLAYQRGCAVEGRLTQAHIDLLNNACALVSPPVYQI